MGVTERAKGARGEREALQLIRAWWPKAERSSTGRTQAGVSDIRHGPEGFAVEVKRQERLNVPRAFSQLARDAGDLTPILVHRPSRHAWMGTMELEELLPLIALRERG